jgi:hypothetical protein
VVILFLTVSEFRSFLTPVRRQRFDLDMKGSVDASAPRKVRVLLNVTIHDFPCIDLSLDYQDVMGTRAVDVKTTIFKQRLNKDGTVAETMQNNPQALVQGGASNPSLSQNSTGNSTCGHCYGALPDGECCNTCSDVIYAYRLKRWALPRIEDIEQCKHDGTQKSMYQPPQIIHLDDYVSDDYLPKFRKLGSLTADSSLSRITTPFRLNFSMEPLKPLKLPLPLRTFQPLVLNFSGSQGSSSSFDFDDGLDSFDEGYLDEDGLLGGGASAGNGSSRSWPSCVARNVIIHGFSIGEALILDLRPHGATKGCWNGDCSKTDKFNSESMEQCALVCSAVKDCHWWSWGNEDGDAKCWIRTKRTQRGKRYGFSSGSRDCVPPANATSSGAPLSGNGSQSEAAAEGGTTATSTGAPNRRLMSFEDDYDSFGRRPYSLNFGPSMHMPMFGMDSRESELRGMRRQQRGESCRIHGYFDTNKVPGNFHIGTHGATTPTYLSYFDEPAPPTQNMQHTINRLAFTEVIANGTGALLNQTQPLDGFDSPKAFTFQYYITVTPATLRAESGAETDGYQFRAGSFVTNELIGPAVFFRLDIDPIRVTYYTEEVRWSRLFVNICAVVGGCIAVFSMLGQCTEIAKAAVTSRE